MERVRCAEAFKRRLRIDPSFTLNTIITMDETMLADFIPERKRMSKQWLKKGSSAPVKAKVQESRNKRMVTTFFDSKGILFTTVAEKGTKINASYFIKTLDEFLRHAKHKRDYIQDASSFFLHMDNCPIHKALDTKDFMATRGFKLVEHPPYSPDLAPADFFLFPKAKDNLAGMKQDHNGWKRPFYKVQPGLLFCKFLKQFLNHQYSKFWIF